MGKGKGMRGEETNIDERSDEKERIIGGGEKE